MAGQKLAGTVIEVQNKDGFKRQLTIDKDTFVRTGPCHAANRFLSNSSPWDA